MIRWNLLNSFSSAEATLARSSDVKLGKKIWVIDVLDVCQRPVGNALRRPR